LRAHESRLSGLGGAAENSAMPSAMILVLEGENLEKNRQGPILSVIYSARTNSNCHGYRMALGHGDKDFSEKKSSFNQLEPAH